MLTIRRILLPTDFSRAAADAERRARALARLFDAELHVLHVTRGKELSELPRRLSDEEGAAADRLSEHVSGWLGLAGPARDVRGEGPRAVRAIRQARTPEAGIRTYADEVDIDLIVIGTHGDGAARGPLLGSVADRIVRTARRPVVTVRPDLETEDPAPSEAETDPRRLIVVPVDFSEPTRALVAHAKHWAATFGAHVAFVHVVEEPSLPPFYRLDQFRARLPERAVKARRRLETLIAETEGPDVYTAPHILAGDDVAERIVAYAEAQNARLILTATHGCSGLRRYVLGGVTDQVLRTAPCPVCALKSYGRSLVPAARRAAGDTETDAPAPAPATD
jgi:nucleotide-binding universal stress UspA family protein